MSMRAISSSLKFVAAGADVTILHSASGTSTATFANPSPITIRTDRPFERVTAAGCHWHMFTAYLPVKPSRTAIGLSFSPDPHESAKYMTPSHTSDDKYVSFGGAGFIYPSNVRALRGCFPPLNLQNRISVPKVTFLSYSAGDRVGVRCDFSTNLIAFMVNGDVVTQVALSPDIDRVFPAISCEKGGVVAEISFDCDCLPG